MSDAMRCCSWGRVSMRAPGTPQPLPAASSWKHRFLALSMRYSTTALEVAEGHAQADEKGQGRKGAQVA